MEEIIRYVFSFWGCVILVAVSATIAGAWTSIKSADCKLRQKEMELALKQDMVNRGMSADEIERVMRAPSAKRSEA